MQNQSSLLKVIINPPGVQSGMPGDNLEIHAIIINQGNQSAVIDVFFDEGFQILNQSNSSPRERLALAPQQSSEVSFEFQIPINAFPGTYDYTLVVDAPEHYPQETPIQYPRQIKVLLKEQTVIRENDPTFSVKPATNPSNPLIYKPSDSLQVIVTVDNRSSRVDRFRLTCPDLEDTWFTIRYPTTGLEGAGLLSSGSGLELNPGSQNQILLLFHPPSDTLAGNYSPTIRLYSNNSPDLVLLELIYIKIPELYRLEVELNTILGKISRAFGKYEVKLANHGNTLRQVSLSAKTQEEEELCGYKFEPSQIRLLPTKNLGVNLTVKPMHWWRRPLFVSGLFINFNIQIEDQQQLPIPEKLPQGTLVWKARPWWQFLLLVLSVLGLLGGGAYIIWRILHPEPIKIEYFKSDSYSYQQGDTVRLSWKIRNIKQLQKLILIADGEETKNRPYDFSNSNIPEELKSKCQKDQQVLTCNNVETEAKKPGKYIFNLEAYDRKERKEVYEKPSSVEIKLNSPPEVVNFQSDKSEYQKGEQINLNWQIKYPQQLAKLQILRKQENGISSIEGELNQFNQGLPVQLKKQCQKDNLVLTCSKITVLATAPGTYTFALQPISKSPYQPNLKPTEIKVNIKPKQFKIVSFTLNGSEQRNLVLNDGTTAIVKWQVEGDAQGIQVDLSPSYNNVGLSGTKEFLVNSALKAIKIIVTDKFTQKQESLEFTVETPPPPINTAPTIPESNVPQVPNIPTAPNNNTAPSPVKPQPFF